MSIRNIFIIVLLIISHNAHAAISDVPLFIVTGSEPNVLFNLSVETPMGGAAYNDQADTETGCGGRVNDGGTVGICYFNTTTYLGIFDPGKCYTYNSTGGYFQPSGTATSNYSCSGAFSGNFMNWATMTAMDAFVFTMTGGDRIQDTETITVVQRQRKTNNNEWFPHKLIKSNRNVAPSTVTPWSDTAIYVYNNDTGTGTSFIPRVQFGTSHGGNQKGLFNVRVKVCDADHGLEQNCQSYGTYAKPEGLVQQNADRMRFAVTSYSLDNSAARHGGVLRANMKYVGPTLPNGLDNLHKEYGTDGIYINDPDGLAGSGGVNHSGVINYLNMFSRYGYKGLDPIGELYYESLRYFMDDGPTPEYSSGLTDSQKGGFPVITTWDDPYLNWCQKCFIIGINDANPWYDKKLPGTFFTSQSFGNISLNPGSADWGEPSNPSNINVRHWTNLVGELQGINNTERCIGCTVDNCNWQATNKLIPALGEVAGTCPHAPKENSYYIAGLAFFANTQDIRPDLKNKQTVSTFMIDTQEFSTNPLVGEMNMLWLAGKYGGFIDKNNSGTPDLQEEWDRDGDGEPDNYVLATNPAKLIDALNASFLDVLARTASAASVATNTTRLGTDTLIFQAKFNSDDWSGQIVAYNANPDGSPGEEAWNTDASGKIPAHGARKIFTWNGSDGLEFIESEWASLSAPQQTSLQAGGSEDHGKKVLNWLRGSSSDEIKNGGMFRNRNKMLGDIVNSNPVYVSTANFGYQRLPANTPGQDKYLDYRVWSLSRRKMLYVGANDGMLHAFDAETGVEQFAYIPKGVYANLINLTDPDYTHKYFVDGSPFVGDAYDSFTNSWKTILVGTTGAGGRSIFALDVTNPDVFNATKVLWEITNDTPGFESLGYTIGQPVLARLQTGAWAVVFGNGFGVNQNAKLFIVDAFSGALLEVIDTQAGGSNGLAAPALVPDQYRTITHAYAGDLLGNLWKFDLTGSNSLPPGWKVAYVDADDNPKPLFSARNSEGQVQPITAPLEVIRQGHDFIILFGTGKYFEVGDNIVGADPPVQSFYGILDDGTRVEISDRDDENFSLQEQEIIYENVVEFEKPDGQSITWPVRAVSNNPVDYKSQRGWYLDLVSPVHDAQGERVVSAPLARSGRIIFTTLIPSDDPCEYGGTSWLMELDSRSGGRLDYSVFDLNLDEAFSLDDEITIMVDGEEIVVPVSGLKPTDEGILWAPKVLGDSSDDGLSDTKIFSVSTGEIISVPNKGTGVGGRHSWRQLR